MSAAVKTVVPNHVHRTSHSISSSSRSGGNRTANDIIERVREAEERSLRPRSHTHSLVLAERDPRSVEDINAEIAALELEAKAVKLERKAHAERDLAMHLREQPHIPDYEYEYVQDRKIVPVSNYTSRPRYEEDIVYPRRSRYSEDLVVYDRPSRSLSRPREQIYITPKIPVDDYYAYERRRSPPRNVVRVEKDRRGRLALVRSSR